MSRSWSAIGMGVIVAGAAASTAAAAEAGAKSRPATQAAAAEASTKPTVVLPLARAPKMEIGWYTWEYLERILPPLEHEPFEMAGFSHLTLPFHYEDRTSDGDANEAQALAFVLSSPGLGAGVLLLAPRLFHLQAGPRSHGERAATTWPPSCSCLLPRRC